MKNGIGLFLVILLSSSYSLWGQCSPDITPPVVIAPLNQFIYVDSSCIASMPDFSSQTTVTDNCDSMPVLFQGPLPGTSIFGSGTAVTVSLTGRDNSFNSSTSTFTVTTADTIGPLVTCPSNQTLALNAACQGSLPDYRSLGSATDNCGSASSITQTPTPGTTVSGSGSTVVTFSSTDIAGNVGSCTFTVTHQDNVPPVALCQNISLFLNAAGAAILSPSDIDGGSSDVCGSVTLTASMSGFSCSGIGANTVTLTVTDGASNTATCTSVVTVVDSTSPNAICQTTTVYLNAAGTATVPAATVGASSTDNCGVVSYTANPSSFGCADLGSNTVQLTVADASGNTDVCPATIMVEDTIAPDAQCQSTTVSLDMNGVGFLNAATMDDGSSDNCSIASFSVDRDSFGCGDLGVNSIVFTATDGSGNSDDCTANIFVDDAIPPVAICANDTLFLSGAADTVTVANLNNGSTDNCGIASITASPNSFGPSDQGTQTVVLTVTDVNGNTDTCTALVEVVNLMSIEQERFGSSISIFPNPTGGRFQLRWEEATQFLHAPVQINITNDLGQVIIQDQWTIEQQVEEHTYDLSTLAAGMYLIEVRMGERRVVRKIKKK